MERFNVTFKTLQGRADATWGRGNTMFFRYFCLKGSPNRFNLRTLRYHKTAIRVFLGTCLTDYVLSFCMISYFFADVLHCERMIL